MVTDDILNLKYWGRVVIRQWWLILICAVVSTAAAGVFSFRTEPTFSGTATLYLNRQKVMPLTIENLYAEQPGRVPDQVAMMAEMIRSTPVLERAVHTLEEQEMLDFETERAPRPGGFPRSLIKAAEDTLKGGAVPLPKTPEERRAAYIAELRREVRIKPSGGGAFVLIGVSSANPRRAAALANAIADSYVWNDHEMLRRSALDAVEWLSGRVKEQRARLEESERKLMQFEGMPAPRVEDMGQLAVKEMTRLQEELLDVRLDILQAETKAQPRAAPHAAERTIVALTTQEQIDRDVQQTLYENLRRDIVQGMAKLDDLKRKYGDKHPDVIRSQDELDGLRARMAGMTPPDPITAVAHGAPPPPSTKEIEAMREQERLLQESLEKSMQQNRSRDHAGMRYAILKHEEKTNRALYDEMQRRLNEITISAGLDSASAEVFERAITPVRPQSPNHPQSLAFGLMFGIILGLAGAGLREHLDSSLRDPQQINDLLNAPVIGVIPDQGRSPDEGEGKRRKLVVEADSESPAADAYRILCSRIEDVMSPDEARALLITSTVPGEGKSTTAANLAAIMAASGYRTLLVDGDTRRSSLGIYFEHDPRRSLEGLIKGEQDIEKMVRASGRKNLSLLTCRPQQIAPDPKRAADIFRTVIAWSAGHFDRLIIDMPVVMYVPGVAEAARAGASILLVHRPGRVPAAVLKQVREHLALVKGRLVGVVLNGVRTQWLGGYSLAAGYYSYTARPLKALKGGRDKKDDHIAS
jgi:capsular exopolysaccharide synthesis family protein